MNPSKYFLYVRKSSESEEKQVMSIEAQIVELEQYAKREGYKITERFIESKSAKTPGRLEFNKMIEKIYAPNTPEQEKAKDFWFLSYACNGMNIKDIALLKNDNLKGETIVFYRAKTINTSKTDSRPITVYLNEYSKGIIDKYRSVNSEKNEYLFTIVLNKDKGETKHNKIKNFTKFINQNLKKLATQNGITSDISTYWARHSFTSNSIRNGASMEFVSEALGHNNLKTTQSYFAGFEDEDKKEFMQSLMNF